ncbi:uncharacterized protein LOC18429399 [Amborella trichopoda]|uniref:DUF599 domain-containing protein n=1 Tax=Amborella trichopoda TaxID=13333 RepID=W1NUL6_AMBTC|nr:uncharacterized protein LOC18429399 [Amborella trichopoda]XP_020519922.1 uncharacterized protein LOC18429399 [Amborella trichopoda]XP_020519923.1 uncharacterized protein LOC18429399 [Amborella trichopoda]XP_020519924.1 uncharacterized protein LOC18429399 [Amborella trichopoda]ERN01317.1 hypothetical protein AMTR_s00002p00255400 [Amborella trichopoda]|eukprot:XP_006838748.1 uncharacterized protein LOC18429399 [Amborella trichopoda]
MAVHKEELDYVLVPMGLFLMVAYQAWLFYRVMKHPNTTVMGINSANRLIWARTMMQDPGKNGVLAVQTLRNNIMASTLLASTAIMLSSLIAIIMTGSNGVSNNNNKKQGGLGGPLVYGDTSSLISSIKFFLIILCFLSAFLFNVQSIRYYSHASILINVPLNACPQSAPLTPEYVGRALNRGSLFWSLGLRAFYFSFPLFLWMFGPIPMFLSCVVLVFMFFFLDVCFDLRVCNIEEVVVEEKDSRI